MNHGLGAYNHRRCRCDICTAANTAYRRAWKRRAAPPEPELPPESEATVTLIRDPGPNWWRYASCKGLPTDWWYPSQSGLNVNNRQALAICARCPVQETCLDEAINNREQHGIWGGLNVRNRRQRRQAKAARSTQTVTPDDPQ